MSRDLTVGMASALTDAVVRPAVFVEGEFTGGTLNLWTGIGDLVWDGKTWTGVGTLLGVSEVEETDEIKAGGVTFTLSAVKTSQIALALSEVRRGQTGRAWLALLTEAGQVIADPKILFRGTLDTCVVQDEGETSTIALTYEHALIDLERPREARYTSQEQRRRYPDDPSLDAISALQDAQIPWGFRA